MAVQEWSNKILVAELENDPAFSEDMQALFDRLDRGPMNIVLGFKAVTYLNSSNIAKLLRLRQRIVAADRHLSLCCVPDSVWPVMLTTGLDKIFTFSNDVAGALATLQIGHRTDGGVGQ